MYNHQELVYYEIVAVVIVTQPNPKWEIIMNAKVEQNVEQKERDLSGLENMFREVIINSGVIYVTVDGQAKKVKKDVVDHYGARITARTNIEKQAKDLTLKRLRQLFNLKGQHLSLKFIEFVNGKLQDERGKEVIHFSPSK